MEFGSASNQQYDEEDAYPAPPPTAVDDEKRPLRGKDGRLVVAIITALGGVAFGVAGMGVWGSIGSDELDQVALPDGRQRAAVFERFAGEFDDTSTVSVRGSNDFVVVEIEPDDTEAIEASVGVLEDLGFDETVFEGVAVAGADVALSAEEVDAGLFMEWVQTPQDGVSIVVVESPEPSCPVSGLSDIET